ncbi:calmodulin-binding protein 60 B-like [Impatiens glandulifera]|uniref:calmodulin-binding protein 60 B-like n=1 Tax=Impatiens glandulifera TaxID=253017 RepID=UPI001FB04E3F|nr:calmodulin-binding protein 60 B-like [Impatiens glandulifera]XP_047342081.1 calmodulin-binding protein 60 B-like [Impatiens glandulifera]XP_047342082.1 calmodulin-binding protein 60 B-like [Impatiens glandulifera]XP_047342083.1 calmodulin-binding protein 60 B-like [Impatiens glandulifera]
MIPKRNFTDSFDQKEEEDQSPKRRFTFANLVRDVMRAHMLHQTLIKMESFLRKVVQEEVERGIVNHFHTLPSSMTMNDHQFESGSGRTCRQLRFPEKIPPVLFTNNRMETEDGKPIRIEMWDVNSEKIVTSGSLSSIKAEIMVMDSDFEPEELEEGDWTEEAFKSKIQREREGKRPLLTGELTTWLKNGVGYFGDVSFSDNSSWVRNRKFRLGARVVPNVSTKTTRVREAISQAFVVKDHRGECQKKHFPPKLVDETWRLKKISKDGKFHKRLTSKGIITVKDFLQSYYTDQSNLRQLLGGGANTSKTWETIVEHANTNTCTLNNAAQNYVYYKEVGEALVGLIFNCVYKNVGASFDGGQNWVSLENLNAHQMRVVERLKCDAYKNINQFSPVDIGFVSNIQQCELTDPFNKQSSLDELKNVQTILVPGSNENGINYNLLPLSTTSYMNQAGDPIYDDWAALDQL